MPESSLPSEMTDTELTDDVAVEVMRWQKRLAAYNECPHCKVRDNKTYQWWSQDMEPILNPIWCGQWDPTRNWNDTMEVWRQLIDMGLAPGIDETDDHTTVVVGRLDGLGDLKIFVHVEQTNAQRAILLAALQAVRSSPESPHA